MSSCKHWKWIAGPLAALLVWLAVVPMSQAAAPTRPAARAAGRSTRPTARPATKPMCCCCRPGHCHCHMAMGVSHTPTGPDRSGMMCCASCSCGPAPQPGVLAAGGSPRRAYAPAAACTVSPAPSMLPVAYPTHAGDALRSRPAVIPEQPPCAV